MLCISSIRPCPWWLIGLIFLAFISLSPQVNAQSRFDMRKREKQILDQILSKENYDSRIRPAPLKINSTSSETAVYVNLLIRSIGRIDDFLMEYTVQFLLRQEWFDARLKFDKLPKPIPSYLTITDTNRAWIPDIFFVNEKESRRHEIIKPNQYIRIYPDGMVLFSVRLSVVFACTMNLMYFPMDSQKCSISMASYGLTAEDLIFEWKEGDPVQKPENLTLPRFFLEDVRPYKQDRTTNTGTYSTLKVDFILRRNRSYYFTQLFIPCIMLVIVSQVNFYIDENAAPARAGLGITTLLTMATQSASINRSLPPVSYTKAIDIWSNVCLMFVFAALMEYALVNYYVRYDKRMKKFWHEQHGTEPPAPTGCCGWLAKRYPSRSKRIDVCARVIFPLYFIIFNIGFWTISLTASDDF